MTLGVWAMLWSCRGATSSCSSTHLFSSFIFHAITALALFTLRRNNRTPHGPTGSSVPWVPALFLVAMTGLVLNTLRERPVQSLLGVGMVALGVPFFSGTDESSLREGPNNRPRNDNARSSRRYKTTKSLRLSSYYCYLRASIVRVRLVHSCDFSSVGVFWGEKGRLLRNAA